MRLFRLFRKEKQKVSDFSFSHSLENGNGEHWLIEQAVKNSNNAIAFASLEGKLTYVNPSFLQIWGYKNEGEVLGKEVIIFWENPENARDIIQILHKSGNYDGVMQGLRADGSLIDIRLSASFVDAANNSPGRLMASFIDITQQKNFERDLREQQQYFKTLADNIPDIIVRIDENLCLTYLNQQALLFSTAVPLDTRGVKISELNLPQQTKDLLIRNIQQVFNRKEQAIIEDKIFHADEEKIFESRLIPEFDSSGRVISVMVIARDVTDDRKLIQQKAHLATIVESSDDAILSKDFEGNILSWNRGAESMYGYTANEMIGNNIHLLIPEEKKNEEKKIIEEILSGNKINHYETKRVCKSGRYISVSLTASPITNTEGKIIAVSVIARDITISKRNHLERDTVYHISQAVIQEKNLNEIFRVIHEKMEILFNTRNFFVALYNKEKNILYIPYYKDERDGRSILDPDRSLTGYMIKKGNPLFLNPDDILKISSEMGIERSTLGAQSKIWMGVPMYSNGEVTGALVVQDYENPDAYTPKDLDFLKFLANQLSLIIEQKKAEEELNLRARLLDVATDSIYMHTADGLISYVNETAVTLTGISLNDIRKSNFYKLFDRAAQASLKEKIKQVSEENDLYLSTLHQTADGKEFPVEIHSKAIVINGEKRILSVVRDITELVKSQDENNKLSEAVLQSPVGVVIALPDGKVEFINPMYYQITGYSPEDIAPYRHSVFDLIPHLQPGKRAEIRNMINNVGRWQYETQSRKKNGELFWESISFSPVKDRNGRFSHYLMINEDITEKKITEKQLIEAKNRAEESDRLKSAFLTNMSHEIRTPLNAIAGFTQLITDNNFSTEKKAGFSHQIKNATLDLISLVSNIIETSKLQSGRIPYEKEKFFVKNLLEEIYIEAIELRDRKEKKHLEIVLQIGVSDQRVMFTDPNKLKQILINLIDNAIKFTEKGQIELGCTLHDSEKICFHVKDTGIGISKKHQKEIFGSFQKVEESGQKLYRGAGLGLTLCQGLTKLLDGEIHVDSQPDRGAEFNVLFPLEENQFEVFTSSVPNKVKNKPQKLKGKKILVAEDVPSNFQYLKELSEQLGLILLEATDGNEAIEKVKETKDIDLILMDILMPEKDGFEAARQIRKMNKSIPIIAQSAFKWNENKKSVYRGVFDDYLTKPFSEEQLTSLLMRHLL